MRTALVFPPFLVSYQPYSSLPTLGAYLRDRGHATTLLDENIEYQHRTLTRAHFETIRALLEEIRAANEGVEGKDPTELNTYLDRCFKDEYFRSIAEHLSPSLAALRDEDTIRDVLRADRAREVVNRAQNLVLQFNRVFELQQLGYGRRQRGLTWPDIESLIRHPGNPYADFTREQTIPRLVRCKPGVIGISLVFEDQLVPAFTLARTIRATAALAKSHVIIGGPVATLLAEEIRDCPEIFDLIDSVGVHEGEQTLAGLLDAVASGGSLEPVPNLLYRNGGSVRTNPTVVLDDLDSLPTVDYEGLPLEKYFSPRLVPVLKTTRGCYWNKCTFCNNRFLNAGVHYRARSAERVYDDFLRLHERFGITEFALWEEAAVPKVLDRLAALIAAGPHRFKWFAEVRLDKVYTPEFLAHLHAGGCRAFVLGLESGNARVQSLMNKGYDLDVCGKVIRDCRRAGIRVYLTSMVGFPSETPRDVFDTLSFLKENARYIYHAGVSHFGLRKYTDTWRFPERFGIEIKKATPVFASGGDLFYEVLPNEGMPQEQSLALYDLMRREIKQIGLEGGEPEAHYLIRCQPRVQAGSGSVTSPV